VDDFKKAGGSAILKHYNDSLQQLLAHFYPDVIWMPWLFAATPKGWCCHC
jgi:hypothetical protein